MIIVKRNEREMKQANFKLTEQRHGSLPETYVVIICT